MALSYPNREPILAIKDALLCISKSLKGYQMAGFVPVEQWLEICATWLPEVISLTVMPQNIALGCIFLNESGVVCSLG